METDTPLLDHQHNGQTSRQVDQLSSIVLMGIAIAGGALAVLVLAILP